MPDSRAVAVARHEPACRRIDHFSQSKIQNLGVTSLGDEDIRGLDVAMDDALGVRGVEGVGDFNGEREHSLHFQGRPAIRCFRVMPSRNSMAMKGWPC